MKKCSRGVALLLMFCLLVFGLSGCASSGGGWSNAQKGGIGGAFVGALVGLKENGLAGALVGAAVGGAAGYMVGHIVDYVQEKDAAAVYSEYGREKRLVFEDLTLSKDVFQGGEQGELAMQYAIVDPDPDQTNEVTHTVEYWQNGNMIASNDESKSVKPGGYTAKFPLTIPKGADEGAYMVVAKIDSFGQTATLERPFRVFYARNDQGVLHVASIKPY